MNSRGQSEIVGLLIIVVLISFIMLFVINSFMSDSDEGTQKVNNEKLASSFLISMLDTNTNCTKNTDVQDLIVACGEWHRQGTAGIQCDDGRNSCEFLNETVLKVVLDNTLEKWNYPYELIITEPNNPSNKIIHKTGNNVSRAQSGQSQPQPLSASSGQMYVWLCLGKCGELT